MKKAFLLFAMTCFVFAGVLAQNGEIANLQVSQRTDGSGLVDIHFDLNGTGASYNLQFEASFDDGANYEPLSVNYLTGELIEVLPGTAKHIIWAGKDSHPETFSTQTRVKVIAVEVTLPTVLTVEITDITAISAISGGNISYDGGAPVTARGVVWSTLQNPTLDENEGITEDGEGDGAFVSIITGLLPDSVYYLRSFAVNQLGVAYGQELTFATYQDGIPCPDSPTVTDIDGNAYTTTLIGDQCWMTENLKTTKYRNNLPIENAVTNTSWVDNTDGAYCWMDNDPYWKNIYGALYNFYAVKSENQLCPDGWHVPSRYEWNTMINYVGGSGSPSGNKLKSCRQINSPLGGECDTDEHPKWDTHEINFGTDNYNLSILPPKVRGYPGSFLNHLGKRSITWTSSGWIPYEGHQGWGLQRSLYFDEGNIGSSGWGQRSGLSVRCVKNSNATGDIPTVITKPIDQIDQTSAVSGGDIYMEGHAVILARGLVWSTNPGPTVESNEGITFNDKSTGNYDSYLNDLTPDTTYYVRAYATNIFGTGYGQELVFETLWECGQALIDDRDGHEYTTVQIGEQCWMTENLNIGTRINGNQDMIDNGIVEKYCYNNSEANCDVYGGLYQWDEMMQYSNIEGLQGICPDGWHLPTDVEWTTLTTYLAGESVAGGKMKTTGTMYWNHPNTGATNESEFSGLPCGYRILSGNFTNASLNANWWSSTEYSATKVYDRYILYNSASVERFSNFTKVYGFSVRCLKD
jgi:uncharacterized protein (TIGR02145 family)